MGRSRRETLIRLLAPTKNEDVQKLKVAGNWKGAILWANALKQDGKEKRRGDFRQGLWMNSRGGSHAAT